MKRRTPHQRVLLRGQHLELWENPDAPFSWSTAGLLSYAQRGEWELLFNALVLLGMDSAGSSPDVVC